MWGDEVEYMLVHFDDNKKQARLLLTAEPILLILLEEEKKYPLEHQTTWRPEYAAYMIEGTPGRPYGHRMAHFNMVEANMRLRREQVMKLLMQSYPDASALSLTSFPRLGCTDFTVPPSKPTPNEGVSRSIFFPDDATFGGHPRFKTLTRNIRERRGEKPAINIPVFRDVNTVQPFVEDYSVLGDDGASKAAAKPDHIYMDCMGFGMGCCCLQMTFQACNIEEARMLYDQLTTLCPIMLALSAASPIHRGYLADTDCRWNVIAASVDDRTKEERGLEPLKENRFVITKSRYDSIDSYLSPCNEKYNDLHLVYDKDIYQTLISEGIDHLLALHISHLFIRDPISLFSEKIDQDDTVDTDHFENLQSTNWQTMRFKPPPPNTDIGWRVEFRPTEVQLTDFENAAYVVFLVLLTRVILSFRLNFVIPISKVDENMKTAQKRDAVLNEKFCFKKDIMTCDTPKTAESFCCNCTKYVKEDCSKELLGYDMFTVDEIINGKEGVFPGLVPLIEQYLKSIDDCDVDTSCTISQYLSLIKSRASGKLMTTARWIRNFVTTHTDYKQNSVVSDSINYDLIRKCADITYGRTECPELLIKYNTKSQDNIPVAMAKNDAHLASMAAKQVAPPGLVSATGDCHVHPGH